MKVVGVPKTIDNDLSATDYTFGFDTAVNIAMEAIDRLHTTADSHHRVLIVEVMGRHAGWIAFHAGLAGGANVILIPEQPFDLERVCELVGRRLEARFAPIVVVSEGASPGRRHAGCRRGQSATPSATSASAASPTGSRARSRPHRQRDAGDRARPRPARRHPDRVRPGARDPLRPARDRRRRRRALGDDDGAAGDRHRARRAERGDGGAEDGAGACTKRPRSSLARVEGGTGDPSAKRAAGGCS